MFSRILVVFASVLSVSCSDAAIDEPMRGADGSPNIVVISLDTTRADRLGLYGCERPTSPNIDALAEHALVFDVMRAPSGNTLLSHASLLTGLFPRAHGARPSGDVRALPQAARSLAEDFAEAGYQTAAFTTHADWLNADFGIDQGFEHFDVSWDMAPEVLARATAWLEQRDRERPFFLFVHLFDAHSDDARFRPYLAPPGFAGIFVRPLDEGSRDWSVEPVCGSLFLRGVHRGLIELRDGDRDDLLAQYDEGLAGLDDQLGGFLDVLRDTLAPEAWISISADHGEEFLEHGSMLHYSLYEEIVRVPWLLIPPPDERKPWGVPRRVPNAVSLLDLRPTLLSIAKLPLVGKAHGRDLTAWLRDGAAAPRDAPFPLLTRGLIVGPHKLVRRPQGDWELYDLAVDPGESTDLAPTDSGREQVRQMLEQLVRIDAEHTELAESLHAASGETDLELTEGALRRLDALGYTR